MRFRPILSVVLTHTAQYLSFKEWIGILWYWMIGIVLYGLIGRSISSLTGNETTGIFLIITLIAIKPSVSRCAIEMPRAILEQSAGHALVATFATPITLSEWTIATMIMGLIGALIRWILGFVLLFLLFNISVMTYLWQLIIISPLLLMAGWTIGIYLSVLTYIIGKKSDSFIRLIAESFIVLCGVFYPIAMLPQPFRFIATQIPTTYIFEGLRAQITTGTSMWPYILTSMELNLLYLGIGIFALFLTFKHVKNRGLASLENK